MPESTTRAEHLKWCKERALAYLEPEKPVFYGARITGREYIYADGQRSKSPRAVNTQQVANAWASIVSDLNKHPETQGHIGISLGMVQIMGGGLSTAADMRHFIEGFN